MIKAIDAPNSKESEMMVLGCMLTSINALAIAGEALQEPDFYYHQHKTVFAALKAAYQADKAGDIHLISEELKRINALDAVGGIPYLTNLAQYAGTSAYIEEYIDELREKSILRQLIETAKNIEKAALSQPPNAELLLDSLQNDIERIKRNELKVDSLYSHLLKPSSEKEISEEFRNISPGAPVGFRFGETELMIPGGGLTFIAGPTGHGKTLTTINMLLNYLSTVKDKKVWFFSYEESRAAILSLFLNTFINKNLSKNNRESIKSYFRDGSPEYLLKDQKELFLEMKNEFFNTLIESGRLNIHYCDYDITQLDGALRFLEKKSNIGLVAIDYVQLLRQPMTKTIQRHEELKHICQIAKDFAVDTGLPVLLLAQFNRTVVNEATMSKLAIGEGGDIERSGNTIIGLWNRNENKSSAVADIGRCGKSVAKESAVYLEILKSRQMPTGCSTVMDLNGNTGKLSVRQPKPVNNLFGT